MGNNIHWSTRISPQNGVNFVRGRLNNKVVEKKFNPNSWFNVSLNLTKIEISNELSKLATL